MQDMPSTAHVRQFLFDAFSDQDLTTLCFDYFRQVYDDLSQGMTKGQKIQCLIEYCERREEMPRLLAALQQARPKQFKELFPRVPHTQAEPTPLKPKRDPKQVFISYVRQDAEFADRLAADLQGNGWRVWIAPQSIQPGEKWAEAIDRGLQESGVFVVVLTPEAVKSPWVRNETYVAIEFETRQEMQFVPLGVKPCNVPPLWRAYQFISFSGGYDRGLKALLGELSQSSPPPPNPAPPPAPAPAAAVDVPPAKEIASPVRPVDARALDRRRQERLPQSDHQQAIADCTKAIEQSPKDSTAYARRGDAYRMLGDYEKAIADLDKAIELDPKDAWAYASRGEAYRKLGKTKHAFANLDAALELDPENAWAYARRGEAYRRLGNNNEALNDFDKAIELNPEDSWAYAHRGEAYRKLDNINQALADLDKAIELDSKNSWAYSRRGEAYHELGNADQALDDLDRAIELDPKDCWAYAHRGEVHRSLGHFRQALTDLDKAVELDPLDSWARQQRDKLVQRAGGRDDE